MSTDHAALQFLRAHGAATIEHPGGTLLDHLRRVRSRLEQHGSPRHVQLAGLTHATYGTDGFGVALLPLTERQALRDVVGESAEELVHRYGSCDRARTWLPSLAGSGLVHDRLTGDAVRLDATALRDFVDLTIVNELDVVEHSADLRARFGDTLRRLFAAWSDVATPAVAADAAAVLGPAPMD